MMDSCSAAHQGWASRYAGGDNAAAPCPVVPPGMTIVGGAKEINPVLRALGCDPEQVIGQAGLDSRFFDHPDNLISIRTLGALAQHCAERTNCAHFGLLVGQRATLKSLRLLGMLMESSDTLGDALRALELHMRVQSGGSVLQLEIEDDVAVLTFSLYDSGAEGVCQILEGALAAFFQAIGQLCGGNPPLVEVLLPRRRPQNTEPYHLLFRGPVRFDQEISALIFPADWLKRSLATADPARRRALEARIFEIERSAPKELGDDLRRLLRIELTKERCLSTRVAQLLSTNRRTLNRRLRAEGMSFKVIADELRYMIARQLLADTDLKLVEIAAALNFSEAAAFTRAFRRWSGATPCGWRENAKVDRQRSATLLSIKHIAPAPRAHPAT